MKKEITMILAATMIIYGCSTPAYVEKAADINLSDYQTFAWVETRAKQDDGADRTTAFADISVHNAVNAELQRWGWREVSTDPDVLVSYDILVERDVERRSDPVYSNPFTRYYYNPYTRRWSTIYYPSQFLGYQEYSIPVKEATITISMMDADTDKKVWQGWTSEQLNGRGITTMNINKSVKNIFERSAETSP